MKSTLAKTRMKQMWTATQAWSKLRFELALPRTGSSLARHEQPKDAFVLSGVTGYDEIRDRAFKMQALRDAGGLGETKLYEQVMQSMCDVNLADAYSIQMQLVRLGRTHTVHAGRHAGWKVGATAPGPQKALGLTEPFHGPLFDRWIKQTANDEVVELSLSQLGLGGITLETELGFGLAKGLEPDDMNWQSIEAAVDFVAPCVEVTARRLIPTAAMPLSPAPLVVADSGGCGAVIIGKKVSLAEVGLSADSLPDVSVSVELNGKMMGYGNGSSVLGHPFHSLAWLAKSLAARGHLLRAGDFVITGTMHGKTEVRPGDAALASFDSNLGALRLQFLP